MSVYNKLFTKILDSSIWLEPTPTRIIWMTLIAVMDEDGFCQFASPANLAHRALVSLPDTEAALACLEAPDKNSSDPDNEGRRIERVPGGWMVLNARKYRDLVTRAVAKEKTRLRVAKHRREKGSVTECNGDVTEEKRQVTPSEAATDSESASNADAPTTLPSAKPTEDPAKAILEFLNKTAGKAFRSIATNLDPIRARMKEPEVTVEGIKQMIVRQCQMWKGDRMEEYLRPETLFGKTKFASYYDSRDLPLPADRNGKPPGRLGQRENIRVPVTDPITGETYFLGGNGDGDE